METINDSRIPRGRMAAAEAEARKRFPDAARIKAVWTPANAHDITLEVWDHNGHARTGALR